MNPAPDPSSGRTRQARWPYALGAGFLALGLIVLLMWPVKLPFFAMSPGRVEAVADIVTVADDVATYEPSGEIYLLTVSITPQEVNAFEWVEAQLDERVDLIARERIRPSGVTREEVTRSNLEAMNGSIDAAIFVALGRLGYEVGFAGEGVKVIQVVEDAPADGVIEVGDEFTKIAGVEVATSEDAANVIRSFEIGDTITLEGTRAVEADSPPEERVSPREPLTLEITLGAHPDIEGAPLVGVVFDTIALEMILPVDIDVDSGNIGGPSAGLAFTLTLLDLLSPEDLTKGNVIAATGTIRFDESVGAIGGVRQKVYAARATGARLIFVPAANYEDAITASGGEIEVVSVEMLQDALDRLESLDPAGVMAVSS